MQPAAPSALANFIPLILIFGIFYFMVIRPQMKRQKEHEAMLNNLKKGDRVVAGGIYGTVVSLRGPEIDLEIAEDVKITAARSAVTTVVRDAVAAEQA